MLLKSLSHSTLADNICQLKELPSCWSNIGQVTRASRNKVRHGADSFICQSIVECIHSLYVINLSFPELRLIHSPVSITTHRREAACCHLLWTGLRKTLSPGDTQRVWTLFLSSYCDKIFERSRLRKGLLCSPVWDTICLSGESPEAGLWFRWLQCHSSQLALSLLFSLNYNPVEVASHIHGGFPLQLNLYANTLMGTPKTVLPCWF